MDIIERDLGTSNKHMLDKCIMLKKILDVKVERKVGRGRNIETILVNKYDNDNDNYRRIVNSIEHYQKLYEEEMREIKEV